MANWKPHSLNSFSLNKQQEEEICTQTEDEKGEGELYGLSWILCNEAGQTESSSQGDRSVSTDSAQVEEKSVHQQHHEAENKCCGCCSQACPQINEQLVVFKAFNFFFYAAVGSLFPYLSVFYKQIWLTARETGILLGIRPLIQLSATPMWGVIADTYGKGKLIFMVSLVAWLLSNYSLSLVSPSRHLGICKDNGTIGIERIEALKHGSHHGEMNKSNAANFTNTSRNASHHISESHRWRLEDGGLSNLREAFGKIKRASTKPEELALSPHQRWLDLTRVETVPTRDRVPELNANAMKTNMIKVPRRTRRSNLAATQDKFMHPKRGFRMTNRRGNVDTSSLNSVDWVDTADVSRDLTRERTERTFDFLNMEGHYPWPLDMITNYASTQDSHEWHKINHDRHLFTLLFLVTFIGNLIAAPAVTLADTATLQALGDSPEDYGKQRLWGAFGWGLGAFIVGSSLNTIQELKNCNNPLSVDYMPCFYAFTVLMGVAVLVGALFEFRTCDAATDVSVLAGIKSFCSWRYFYFTITILHCGCALGFIEVFLFWHLEDLGGTQLLFSIITTMHCVSEIIVYRLSGQLIKLCGHHMLIYAGLACYAVRFFVYAFTQSSWLVLPFELLHGISTAAVWSAAVTYVGLISGAPTTMQGILGSVHWSLGGGGGGIVGGFLVSYVGAARSFSIFGILTAVDLLLFILVNNWKFICPSNNQEKERSL